MNRARALIRRRARSNVTTTRQEYERLQAECLRLYPPVKPGLNIISFGVQGANQQRRYNDCMNAALRGATDPRTTVTENAALLWTYAEPWSERREDPAGVTGYYLGGKTGGDVLRTLAKGFKPYNISKFQDFERKATILGALSALSMIGVAPYNSISEDQLPTLKLADDTSSIPLIRLTQEMAAKEGVKLPPLSKDCAEYLRKRVIKAGAEAIAWNIRALALTLAGQEATDKRSKVEGVVSSTSATTANALHAASAIPPFVQAIVTEPIAIIMDFVGAGFKAAEGRTRIENARIDADVDKYRQEIQQELELRNIRVQQDLVAAQIAKSKEQMARLQDEATSQGKLLATGLTAAVGFTLVGGLALVVVKLVQRIPKKRSTRRKSV